MTKPTRIRPVTAITAFFPIGVDQRVIAPLALISASRLCVLPRVRLHPVLVEVAAVGVVDHHHREVFHLQATDGLRPQVRVGDDLELLHEAREHRARAADRAEVHGLVQLEGLLDRLGARALADRALEPELEERGRMDKFTPTLLKLGLKGTIGKGARSEAVKEALKLYKAVYFGAIGGAGAVLSRFVKKLEIVAYADLGTEAIRRLEVEIGRASCRERV